MKYIIIKLRKFVQILGCPESISKSMILAIAFMVIGGTVGGYIILKNKQFVTKEQQTENQEKYDSQIIARQNSALPQMIAQFQAQAKAEFFTFLVSSEFRAKTVYHGKINDKLKAIALTFDDGPWGKTTEEMLDILKQNHVKATFFWVGQSLENYPEIARKVVKDGHAIGNHTWHHWYKQMDEATAMNEIERTAALIYKITGVKTTMFRPPGGFLNNGVAAYAKKQGYAVVMWSLTSADTDWHAQPSAFVNNVLKGAKPGAIVLMHDGGGDHAKTVKALPEIIAGLKQQGYYFVTVPELLKNGE